MNKLTVRSTAFRDPEILLHRAEAMQSRMASLGHPARLDTSGGEMVFTQEEPFDIGFLLMVSDIMGGLDHMSDIAAEGGGSVRLDLR